MQTSLNLSEYSVAELQYSQNFMERGYKLDRAAAWNSVNATYEKFMRKVAPNVDVKMALLEDNASSVFYEIDRAQVIINFDKKGVKLNLATFEAAVANDHIAILKKVFSPILDRNDHVRIRFWYNTSSGPTNVTRNILVPDWPTIRENYEPKTLGSLEYLMNDFRPSGGGQLIIFHGEPGTGKSYSLRALLDAWRSWATADYVLDPDYLFSGPPGYLASLVLRGARDEYEYDDEEDAPVPKHSDKWKLLILEDSGELLSTDAKNRTGQGLSRLLNLVDGLIGQGLRVLVLITTNEELGKLHPAVSREGRCAAAVQFRPFTWTQANEWLAKQNEPASANFPKTTVTLADLYAHTRKDDNNPQKKLIEMDLKQIGFQMR